MDSEEPSITKVHEDARGPMYAITLPGDRELMLLFSKTGSRRGGHSHNVSETVLVLTGRLLYHTRYANGEERLDVLKAGESESHPRGRIHMADFLEPTWLIEWKHAKKGEWRNENYAPWREMVDANIRS